MSSITSTHATEAAMSDATLTELASRRNDGLEITLYWARADDSVHLEISNERNGSTWAFPVDRARALDAFHHPFAYAA
jgi:hypothetical protein